jgi:hypothetical protein
MSRSERAGEVEWDIKWIFHFFVSLIIRHFWEEKAGSYSLISQCKPNNCLLMYRVRVVMQSNKVVKSMVQCLVQSTCCHLAAVMVMTFGMMMVKIVVVDVMWWWCGDDNDGHYSNGYGGCEGDDYDMVVMVMVVMTTMWWWWTWCWYDI